MVELRHIRYFLAIAESRGFTRAAARLRVTQPTLSHQIKQLEREVGAPLFDRAGNTVRLTEQGKVFKDYAEQALKELDSGLTAVAEMEGQMHGRLTIGVFASFSGSLLPAILAEFSEHNRKVHVEVRQLAHSEMERQLLSGDLHLAVGYAPATTGRIVAENLLTEPLVLIVGRLHPFFNRRRIRLRELHDQPLALLSRGSPSRELIDRCLESNGVVPRVMLEMNSNEGVLATVRASALATLRVESVLRGAPDLRAVRIAGPMLERTTAIFWNRGYRSAAARAVADLIKQAYAAHAGRRSRGKPRQRGQERP